MQKIILCVFDFFKNILYLCKILSIFCILMLLMIWVQDLTNQSWGWTDFIKPLIDIFIIAGAMISSKSIKIFEATFEYKYMWAMILFLLFFGFCHILIMVMESLSEACCEGHRIIKKMQEQAFNKFLEKQITNEQEHIKKFLVFVSTSVKKKFAYEEYNINIDEQNKIMNKFLISKTGINPIKVNEGFLFSFNDFNHVDDVLEPFFKLIKSDSPLDYIICVQIISQDADNEKEHLKELIDLKFFNKITTMSDTIWRYKFNKTHKYSTSQLGLFQKNGNTFEVHQFEEM